MGENAQPSRPHIGRGDKDLRALGFPHRLKIDEALDQVFQRVDVERIEIVRRKILRYRLEPDAHRRIFERYEREQSIDRFALRLGEVSAVARRVPEIGEPPWPVPLTGY